MPTTTGYPEDSAALMACSVGSTWLYVGRLVGLGGVVALLGRLLLELGLVVAVRPHLLHGGR